VKTVTTRDLQQMVGTELGTSEWFLIDQGRIDAFADTTVDHQYIHVDPERAAQTPFGTTIAHGFLTLSLLIPLLADILTGPEGTVMAINYGTNRLRFLEPVGVDSRVRARAVLAGVADKGDGRWLVQTDVTVEIEGGTKPALVVELLTMFFTA